MVSSNIATSVKISTGVPAIHALDLNSSGIPVVLLHGLGSNSSAWGLQFPVLVENGFRALAPDLPGYGQTDRLNKFSSIAQIAKRLSSWYDELNLESAHLVGLSLGGVVALQFALDFPDRVQKLVMVNSFAKFEPGNSDTWFYLLKRFLLLQFVGLEAQAQAVAENLFPKPSDEYFRMELHKQILQSDPHAYRETMLSLARFNVLERLPNLNQRTLIVSGEQDTTVPLCVQKRMAEGIPFSRQVVIPGTGHAAPVQKPDIFNRILIDFLLEPY